MNRRCILRVILRLCMYIKIGQERQGGGGKSLFACGSGLTAVTMLEIVLLLEDIQIRSSEVIAINTAILFPADHVYKRCTK